MTITAVALLVLAFLLAWSSWSALRFRSDHDIHELQRLLEDDNFRFGSELECLAVQRFIARGDISSALHVASIAAKRSGVDCDKLSE